MEEAADGRVGTASRHSCYGWRVAASGGRWRDRDAMTSHPPLLGRANHPWLAAAEQGCSALPRGKVKGDREEAAGISLL